MGDIKEMLKLLFEGGTIKVTGSDAAGPPPQRHYLEIVGFWTPEYLQKKLAKLRAAQTKMLIAVDKNLKCTEEELGEGKELFRATLLARTRTSGLAAAPTYAARPNTSG